MTVDCHNRVCESETFQRFQESRVGKFGTRAKAAEVPKLSAFESWSERLRRQARKASQKEEASDEKLRPRQRADNVFKLSAYRYYRELKQAGLLGALRQYVEGRDGSQWKGRGDADELWVLRLAAKGLQTDNRRKERSRWAAEFKLACLNDVDPDLLLGFLYEAGTIEAIERDAREEVKYKWAKCYRRDNKPRHARQPRTKNEEYPDDDDGWLLGS